MDGTNEATSEQWQVAATRFHDDLNIVIPALAQLLFKFHIETHCGFDDSHWAECEAAQDALDPSWPYGPPEWLKMNEIEG